MTDSNAKITETHERINEFMENPPDDYKIELTSVDVVNLLNFTATLLTPMQMYQVKTSGHPIATTMNKLSSSILDHVGGANLDEVFKERAEQLGALETPGPEATLEERLAFIEDAKKFVRESFGPLIGEEAVEAAIANTEASFAPALENTDHVMPGFGVEEEAAPDGEVCEDCGEVHEYVEASLSLHIDSRANVQAVVEAAAQAAADEVSRQLGEGGESSAAPPSGTLLN